MAPYAADTAVATRKQPRRPANRIVPAVPFVFSRPPPSAKTSSPEEPVVTPQPVADPHHHEQERAKGVHAGPQNPVQAPPTPESRASDVVPVRVDASAAASSQPETQPETQPDTQPETQDEASETSSAKDAPSSTPAPVELPPPFYPAEKTMHTAQTHASVEGLVFGGAPHESPAVPSTPHELEPEAIMSEQPFARAPPGFVPPPFAPPFYPGHSHHPSEGAHAPWLYPQYPMAPHDSLHSQRPEYSAPPFQPGNVAYQTSYQGQFSPPRAPPALNGAARSHSQSPNKSHFDGAKPVSDYDEEQRLPSYHNGTKLQTINANLEESPFELAAYLASQFGNPEFADFILQVRSDDAILLSLPIHGIVVARSPVIAQAIHSCTMSAYRTKDSRRLVDMVTPDKYVTSESLNEAIKVLYGAPLLSVESFTYGLRPFQHGGEQGPTYNEARKRMGQAISYAAAGRALRIPSVQARGNEIVKGLLRWDTFDQAIHFGLDGRPPRGAQSSGQNGAAGDQGYAGSVEAYGIAPLHDAVDFMAYNFPPSFALYGLASELRSDPRLPSVVDFRPSTHNPRLSRIQFGDAPPEDDLKPDYVSRTLSSALLSLPVACLQRLFTHRATANQLGWTGVARVMREVVDEREKRRLKTLKGQLRPSDGAVPKLLLENLYWEERVEASSAHASGFTISEMAVGEHA